MSRERDTRRLQVTVGTATGAKIEELALRLNVSESKMVELLLDAAIEDNEWIIRAVTSRWAKALREVLAPKKRASSKPA